MDVVRREWCDRLFHPTPTTDDEIREFITYLYSLASLPAPTVFIFDSPMGCQLGYHVLKQSVGQGVEHGVWQGVRQGVEHGVWQGVRQGVGQGVRQGVRHGIWQGVEQSVWQGALQGVEQIGEPQSIGIYGDISDYAWLAFYDFFHRIGVITGEKFIKYARMNRGIFSTLQYENVCLVSRLPTVIRRDERGRLHSTDGSAIEFADGYGQWFVHGVAITEEMFARAFIDKQMTAQEIMTEKNVEVRAALIAELMSSEVLTAMGAMLIGEETRPSKVDGRPTTCRLYDLTIGAAAMRCIQVEDHTRHEMYYHFVPKEDATATVLGAIAWMFRKEEKDMQLLKRES
jgi:hypothetical protein